LKINASKFDLICNTVDNGIILINKNLEVFFWNKWLEIRTGITIDDIKNKNLIDFYPNINKSKLQRKITTALKLNSPTFYTPQISEFLFNIELGKVADKVFDSMQQSITITPFDVENELLIIYIYDVTLLSEINFKLKNMKEEVEEKNEELNHQMVKIKTELKKPKNQNNSNNLENIVNDENHFIYKDNNHSKYWGEDHYSINPNSCK